MFNYADRPQSPFKVIGDSFRLFKASFPRVWLWQLIFSMPAALHFSSILGGDTLIKMHWNVVAIIAVYVIGIIFSLFGGCAVIAIVHRGAVYGDCRFNTVIRFAFRKMWIVFFFMLLLHMVGGVMIGVVLAVHAIPYLPYILGSIFGIFVLYSMLAFILYMPNIIVDDLSFKQALMQSYKLVWGRWWRTFIVMVISYLPYLVLLVMAMVVKTHQPVVGIVLAFLSAGLGSFFILTSVLAQLHDLKLRYKVKQAL